MIPSSLRYVGRISTHRIPEDPHGVVKCPLCKSDVSIYSMLRKGFMPSVVTIIWKEAYHAIITVLP